MFRKSVLIALIFVYLVIIAGAVVRMTGSGMGCPDWPKCFGYVIPPTEEGELLWQPNKAYRTGQVIIVDETLQVAASDFITGDTYNDTNWNLYEKHDYAVFNPLHTWVEYINRLVGALAGVAVFVMAILSFWQWKKSRRRVLLSWLSVFLMGFQGWLGATVVYSVLAPVRITLHMIVALIIVGVLMYLLFASSEIKKKWKYDKKFKTGMVIALLLTLFQIAMGTQVRQFVDEQVKLLGYDAQGSWLNDPGLEFYFHRTFSIIVLFLNVLLFMRNRNQGLHHGLMAWIMLILGVEIVTGMAMYYLDFPFLSQPLHLILASILFGVQFYIALGSFKQKRHGQLAADA
ncbi:MAG: heme A synthase [Cytophagaceae bacterium]|nr:heme A synthase [Cytophagaceae bacterium]